jgi:epoxyqueuosine reductase QueG
VIVAAVHTPDSAWELGGEPIHNWGPASCVTAVNSRLERIGMGVAKFLEREGFLSVPIPQTAIWRYRPYKELDITFSPDLSHIHAAAAAGLGEIGFNGLLLTPEFGARQRFMTIITEADLDPDPLYGGPPLCDKCMKCVKKCAPSSGLRKEVDGVTKVDIGGKIFEYANKNKFRCAWAERFQLSFDAEIPDVVDEKVIAARLPDQREGYGSSLEPCWRYCVPKHSRDSSPSRKAPVRKSMWAENALDRTGFHGGLTAASRLLTLEVEKIILDKGIDIFGVAPAAKIRSASADPKLFRLSMIPPPFSEKWGSLSMDPAKHLPEAANVICLGMSFPEECRMKDSGVKSAPDKEKNSNHLIVAGVGFMNEYDSSRALPLVESAIKERIMDAILDVTRHLEEKGYPSIGLSYLPDNYAAEACGIGRVSGSGELITDSNGNRQIVTTVITAAPLLEVGPRKRSAGRKGMESAAALTQKIKSLALERGADMAGVADAAVFDGFKDQLKKSFDEAALGLAVHDKHGRMGGPRVDTIVERKKNVITGPGDILEGAKSVIVIGAAWPKGVADRAEKPPAEAVGPHSMFAQHCTWLTLNNLALDIVRLLNSRGFRAVPVEDLNGTATRTAHTFGEIIDLRANAFAAAAAGLAEVGWCGFPLTRDFGVRQRFYAVVTDAGLDPSPALSGPPLCKKCKKCAEACPAGALSYGETTLSLGGKTWTQAKLDSLRCDWAKRYGFMGDEGPKFMGSQTDIAPPDKIDADAIAGAMKRMDPLQKRIPCIVEKCLMRCAAETAG